MIKLDRDFIFHRFEKTLVPNLYMYMPTQAGDYKYYVTVVAACELLTLNDICLSAFQLLVFSVRP